MKRKPRSTPSSFRIERLEDRLCMSAMTLDTPATAPASAAQAQISQAYGQLPMSLRPIRARQRDRSTSCLAARATPCS